MYGTVIACTNREDGKPWEVCESIPFPADVVQRAKKDNGLKLVTVQVAGTQRHDEVSQADQS